MARFICHVERSRRVLPVTPQTSADGVPMDYTTWRETSENWCKIGSALTITPTFQNGTRPARRAGDTKWSAAAHGRVSRICCVPLHAGDQRRINDPPPSAFAARPQLLSNKPPLELRHGTTALSPRLKVGSF